VERRPDGGRPLTEKGYASLDPVLIGLHGGGCTGQI